MGLTKLGLGGHSFIAELGNDPPASFDELCAIVAACLDQGIRLIDTTYYQERVALGKVLSTLGRREQTEIMAWNFFKQSGKEESLVDYTPLQPTHIDSILEELQTSYLDVLVIHAHREKEKLWQELELADRWKQEGKIRDVGLGMAQPAHLQELPVHHPVTYVLAPYNIFNSGAKEMFSRAKEMGLKTIALSPFVRGWKLDEIGGAKDAAADILLRWVTSQNSVDRVIVSMRKEEWVKVNIRTEERGLLTDHEKQLLRKWVEGTKKYQTD